MNSKKILGLAFLVLLGYIILCFCSCSNRVNDDNIIVHDTIYVDSCKIKNASILRIKVLDNGTITWVHDQRAFLYHVGDSIKVNLNRHAIEPASDSAKTAIVDEISTIVSAMPKLNKGLADKDN